MKLVIVESPTKAKTIGKFLGDEYAIKASMGHIMDLPKSKLGVDVEHDFTPQFELSTDKKKTLSEIQKLAVSADTIILATDPDREGEAIAAHMEDMLSSHAKIKKQKSNFQRIVFHEITKEAIDEALQHPGSVNEHLVDAQTARRVLDRLVGYKLSPLLWQKVRRGLSAGRVQSVALRLIVEREKEIKQFAKKEYWTIVVSLSQKNTSDVTEFELIEINGKKIETSEEFGLYDGKYKVSFTAIADQSHAKTIENDLQTKQFIVADVVQKETRRSPQMPYTTSTLQQDASRRFGLSGKRTMSLAQKLYEEGYITYHRTDSVNMAQKAIFQIRDFVKKNYGEQYILEKPRFYKTKQKLAQEAHEAIRPTNFRDSAPAIKSRMGEQYARLYDMIWRRAVASQMSDAVTQSTTVFVDAKEREETTYRFKTNGSVLLFDGFLKVNPFGLQDRKLAQFTVGEQLALTSVNPEQHFTPPPPRYNDASLVGSLEDGGIGRPSTYATIIGTIEARNYIEREQGRFIPTSVGVAVNDFLVAHFATIDDIPFTATMEDELDAIAQGTKAWVPVMKEFYAPFEKTLEQAKTAERVKIAVEETDEMCPKCNAYHLVIRTGRFGKFLSCKNFPTCDFKKPLIQSTHLQCPKCKQGEIIIKKTRKGRKFYGCSKYPNCDFAAWKLQDIKKGKK